MREMDKWPSHHPEHLKSLWWGGKILPCQEVPPVPASFWEEGGRENREFGESSASQLLGFSLRPSTHKMCSLISGKDLSGKSSWVNSSSPELRKHPQVIPAAWWSRTLGQGRATIKQSSKQTWSLPLPLWIPTYHCAPQNYSTPVELFHTAQSCPTLCNPIDCGPPGFSVHGILQAKILKWVAILFSRRIFLTQGSNPGLLCLLHCRQILYPLSYQGSPKPLGISLCEWGRQIVRMRK